MVVDTIRRLLRRPRPLVVRDADAPLAISDAARERLDALGRGRGIHLATIGVGLDRTVETTEGEIQGPSPPALEGLPITVSDGDLALLAGRTLDWRDGRWVVTVGLELRARGTPNPDSRLYLCDRVLAIGRPAFFVAGSGAPEPAGALLAVRGITSVLFRDHTVTVEREPSTPWEAIDAAVDTALRRHLHACGAVIDGGADRGTSSELEEQIRAVLVERILPGVHRDGGDLELVGVSNGVVRLSMVGACRSCPSSVVTLKQGVEQVLKEAFPGRIERVEQAE